MSPVKRSGKVKVVKAKSPAKKSPKAKPIRTTPKLAKASVLTVSTPFAFFAPDATSVHLAGSFNEWQPKKNPMKKGADGNWSTFVDLAAGRYEYQFVLNGHLWECDHQHNGERCPNGYGGFNSVRVVK